jgi:hypothetical protein
MPEQEDSNAEPLRFLSAAYRTIRARAANGHTFTLDEIECIVAQDPPTARAFAELADAVRAGRDVTVAELAQRARMPEEFVVLLVDAFVAGMIADRQAETLQ